MNSVQNNALTFHNVTFNPIVADQQVWLTSAELAKALKYSSTKSISTLFSRNADEFTPAMTQVIEMMTSGNYRKKVRVFSIRGAHLVAMFSTTPVAKEFRRWALDVMDKEVGTSPIKRRANFNFPIETADPHDRKFGNAWMTPRVILDEKNRAPELELLAQLEKEGYDVTGARIRIHAMYGITKQLVEMQKELSLAKRLMSSLNDVITNQTHERGANISFTGNNKGIAYGGLPKRKLN
ncbi:BRO family protein [Buttiauxella sp. 3AFRM03]|uniref:BRO-N domain-containing protein n=1 Tax=Buttiauxella sp. 3AFRM03 TaxID=2479367 RepID=UPI001EE3A65A|nr:BRO family protein [Buttiauxella sp. 3AFRM03]